MAVKLCENFPEKDLINKKFILKEDGVLSQKSDLIFVVAEFLVKQHKKYQEKVHIVPNGVDVELIIKIKDISLKAVADTDYREDTSVGSFNNPDRRFCYCAVIYTAFQNN